jgi:hypothetical protein
MESAAYEGPLEGNIEALVGSDNAIIVTTSCKHFFAKPAATAVGGKEGYKSIVSFWSWVS